MEDTKPYEPVTSGTSTTTDVEPTPDATAPEASDEQVAPSESSCCAGDAHVPLRQPGVYAPITVDLPSEPQSQQLADFLAFLRRTWLIWTIAIGAVLGVFLTISTLQRLKDANRAAQLKQYDRTIASVTPDRLILRCGQPTEDTTKEIFPMVLRTIEYKPWAGEPLVFTFSRTAEQKSDWVFLTMKTKDGTKSFDTPESKITAFSCLDSTR